ncbi:hypothetical protein CKA32_002107 [Geitlerinema sp. FC II]|nr:hypothetical protein CKA32_002107 [Geitlerinema sp. FC II]
MDKIAHCHGFKRTISIAPRLRLLQYGCPSIASLPFGSGIEVDRAVGDRRR